MKPVLFVTGHAPAYRAGALAELHARETIELALFGGRSRHGGPAAQGPLAVPSRAVRPFELYELAASGSYRAVVCPTGGRLAPLLTWAGARRGDAPLILWASLWAHPRSLAHGLTYLPLRRLYRSADAVVTYGEHVSDYVRARGARNVYVAPQSVDNRFWSARGVTEAQPAGWPQGAGTRFLFVGRAEREKGLHVLLAAWSRSALASEGAALVLVGAGLQDAVGGRPGVYALGAADPTQLRGIYAAADALVVPSIQTRTFLEPWGLVVNEAMNQGLPVISSDAVGAAAGGLVRDQQTGLVVAAGDPDALAVGMLTLVREPDLRTRLGAAGARAVSGYDHEAWAKGFSRALASLGLSAAAEGAGSFGGAS